MEQAGSVSRMLVSRKMALREMYVVAHVMEAWRSEVDWSTGIGQQSNLHLEVVSREVDNKEAGWGRRGSLHEYNGALELGLAALNGAASGHSNSTTIWCRSWCYMQHVGRRPGVQRVCETGRRAGGRTFCVSVAIHILLLCPNGWVCLGS